MNERVSSAGAGGAASSPPGAEAAVVFMFADIAGFTALTDAHGDERAADLATGFFTTLGRLLPAYGAEQVKTIGDAVLLRVADAAQGVRLGVCITGDLLAEHGDPVAHVGMHFGRAVLRDGDWFGSAVNLAARVAGEAAGDEVLLTDATRRAAGEVAGVRFEPRGERRLRNVSDAVELWAAVATDRAAGSRVIDPVCRMVIDLQRCAGRLRHAGTEYHFCSLRCAGRFAADPEKYV